jgi:glycosyltransferase involved in cell wall biosynthesis
MKILFLTRWFPPYAGKFIERHAQAVSLFNELVVLAILPEETSSGRKPVIDDNGDHPGFRVIRYFYRPSRCRIEIAARMMNLIRFVIRAFKGYHYISKHYGAFDLIHVHILTRAAVPAFLLNLFTGIPYIISEHWTRYIPENWGFTGIVRRSLTRLIVNRASAVTTVSDFLRSAMQDCGLRNKKFIIIPNTIDKRMFTIAGKDEAKKTKRILHVSNFHERAKNIYGILRVIKILLEQRNDFEIIFIGGREPALAEARKYASDLGLECPRVMFKGPVPAAELADAYRESSFLLMFSNFESFSIVILEALSCGTPVLATAVGGIPEYFSPNAGRLTPPGDEVKLLDNLNFMLDHYESFDQEYLASLIENRFGLNKVGGQFDEIYRSVLNRQCLPEQKTREMD